MVHENFGNVFVDVCGDGCHGVWFDGEELSRLDHRRKGGGPALQRALAADTAPSAERPLTCPRCEVEMDTIEYDLHQAVAIDSCPECTGVFLDVGELALIRSRELTAEELQQSRTHFRRRLGFRRRRREQEQRYRAGAMMVGFSAL